MPNGAAMTKEKRAFGKRIQIDIRDEKHDLGVAVENLEKHRVTRPSYGTNVPSINTPAWEAWYKDHQDWVRELERLETLVALCEKGGSNVFNRKRQEEFGRTPINV